MTKSVFCDDSTTRMQSLQIDFGGIRKRREMTRKKRLLESQKQHNYKMPYLAVPVMPN